MILEGDLFKTGFLCCHFKSIFFVFALCELLKVVCHSYQAYFDGYFLIATQSEPPEAFILLPVGKYWFHICTPLFAFCIPSSLRSRCAACCFNQRRSCQCSFSSPVHFSQISTLVQPVEINSCMTFCFSSSVKYLPAFFMIFLSMFYTFWCKPILGKDKLICFI